MKKILVLIAAMIIFSGCIDQKSNQQKTEVGTGDSIGIGDRVAVDYTGSLNGKVFDTSIENIAKENNLSISNRKGPLRFIVGKDQVIKGFEEGIIGMKLGESKTLIIPPENAYGLRDPGNIETIPIIQTVPATRILPREFEIPTDGFGAMFGPDHKIGDNIQVPNSNVNLTIQNISTDSILVSYNLSIGNEISNLAPWNETVIKIDDKNITTMSEAKKNDIIQLKGAAWNTTIIDVNSENITLRHNFIPDAQMRTRLGQVKIHFNDTYITLDGNNELAGETVVFNVTIKSIEKSNEKSKGAIKEESDVINEESNKSE